jgi:hypothetical protein
MLLAGEVGLDVEMRSAPVLSLRDDAGPTKSDTGIVVDAGQERPKFRRDADAVLALENAGLDHVFEEGTRGGETARTARWAIDLGLQDHFPAFGEPIIVDRRRDQARLRSRRRPRG